MAYYYHPLVTQSLTASTQSAVPLISNVSSQSSPQTGSDALSSMYEPSSSGGVVGDAEWVVFSPFDNSYSELSEQVEDEDEEDSGVSTPLAFPAHDGIGSFTSEELNDRVNAWRLDQSELVMQEISRLEHKYNHGLMESFGIEDEQGSEQGENNNSNTESFWELLRRKIVREFIGLDDGIMELLAGVSFVDPEKDRMVDNGFHYQQSLVTGPTHWESELIDKVFKELRLPRANDLPVVQHIHRFLGKYWEVDGGQPEAIFI
ncbi:hypothetical protein TRICI_004639 [Trichomonascus ciferrii]|uniref:Uncharacterized protein n=1 Tax=Trichomonascus ciferrii TaxID=44093 RepID=A0A642V099_9ASCO|nr:hypothetical protein TRICI_004639 [Trichomonascus ciferrii]